MSLRTAATAKLEAAVIVVLSTSLAIWGADQFERSGPDRELLKQLKEMQEARRAQGGNAELHDPAHGRGYRAPRIAHR